MLIYLICLAVSLGVIAIDLTTKYFACVNCINKVIIPHLVKFEFSWNSGAAFSLLSDKDWAKYFFIIITALVCIGILICVIYFAVKKRVLSKWLLIALSLVLGGAVGNLVDRIMFGKVRDFIFVFYNTRIFPAIFNVADMALVIGVIMIIIYLLFISNDAIFKFEKKSNEIVEGEDKKD